MKKILYIHQYFITPNEAGGTRSYWFAQELLKNNCEVVMLSSRSKQKNLIEKENVDGIEVVYIKNYYDNSFGIFKRIWSFMRFMTIATAVAFKQKNIGLVFATSTPLTIGVPAILLKWIKRKKFIFEVRDLWPEVPIQMGGVNSKVLIWILRKFERIIYNNASHIITLSPGMKEGVLNSGIEESKVSMIPNMSKIDQFYLREKDEKIIQEYKLSTNDFHIIHFGAMGLANGLNYIIEAAKIIQKRSIKNVKFIFAGAGGQEDVLKELVHKYNLKNVAFLGKFGMEKMSKIVNIADCSITVFSNLPILQTNSPNKLFDSLSAQKPIIVNSAGWTKKMVEENNCGAYVDPTNPDALCDLIIKWKSNPSLLLKMGINSRKLAETVYDKSILSKEFAELICNKVS